MILHPHLQHNECFHVLQLYTDAPIHLLVVILNHFITLLYYSLKYYFFKLLYCITQKVKHLSNNFLYCIHAKISIDTTE